MARLSRNVLETLWQEGDFVLSRSSLADEASPVLVLAPASEQLTPGIIGRLEHAYSLREQLDPSSVARPLRLLYHGGLPTLLLEDPGGDLLARLLGQPWELSRFLLVAIGVAAALGRLHTRGLLHRDLNPANVLVNLATGQAWLIGVCSVSRLPRGHVPTRPEGIRGSLAYIAPEETGRMNRSIDARSDLYSLGVTFYEMLTGVLPFDATDPSEWVHCHIARQPAPPSARQPDVPAAVSAIILKLLAKTAEERYQTAAGLEADLRRCLAEWESLGRIDPFPLGTHDMSARLPIPDKLYGRGRESNMLLDAFEQVVATGRPNLVLVSGYSGIGKSSFVNQLHKAIVQPHGIFISGKFDQHKRDIPYATIAQAFQTLIRKILGKSEVEVDRWRSAIREAIGLNGQLMVNLIPEVELVIGKQPPLPEVPATEAESRFHMVFRSFLGVFARKEHPLALFLDDLQWLDAATLKLLEDLIVHPDVKHLLLIGAFRDNEVSSSHPLRQTLDAIRQTGAIVRDIVLGPLSLVDVTAFVAATLHCRPAVAEPLASLVHQKTLGNPFFVIQFITALHEELLLAFDPQEAIWKWDLDLIRARRFTDNVVDLMVSKLERLPDSTRETLKRLACLGNIAGIPTLAMLQGRPEEEVHADLWEAVRRELIVRLEEGSYKFVHDHTWEATYSLIPEELRAEAHLRIARLLAKHTPPEKLEEAIFEILNQVNRGAALLTFGPATVGHLRLSQEEREQIADLYFIAGKRAKTSTAYDSALKYLIAGRALLGENSWEQCYALTFALEFHRAECEFLTGDFAAAEERLTTLSHRAQNLVDRAAVTRLQTELYTSLNQSGRAVQAGLEYLRQAGIHWSPHPTDDDVQREYKRIWQLLGNRPIESLVDLPPMSDPTCRATLDVLTAVEEPAHFTDENLRCLVVARMANLSLEHGNSDGSCVAYVHLGWFLGPRFGDQQAAFRFAKLALDLAEKHGLIRFRDRVSQCFGYFVNPWSGHLRTSVELLRRSFATAQEVGDLKYAAYSCDRLVTVLLAAGEPLGDAQREAEKGLEFARKTGFNYLVDIIVGQLCFIRTLRGLTPSFSSFNDAEFDEDRFEQNLEANPHPVFAARWYWIRKLQARFHAGDYTSALAAAAKAERLLTTGSRNFESAKHLFYSGLARAAQYNSASPEGKVRHREALAIAHEQIAVLAENCPENFESWAALIAAEIARINGRELDAERLYEKAIQSAREHRFVHNEAIAQETAARFYSDHGLEIIARAYLQNARRLYVRWGALGKVKQLDRRYPELREQPRSTTDGAYGSSLQQVDVLALVKASQAVSSELELGKLIETLLVIALKNAGAQRGVLILLQDNVPQIEAEAVTAQDAVTVHLRQAAPTPADLPDSILRYVIRTQDSIILDDASLPNEFSGDAYIQEKQARSVLCLPLVKQTSLKGALYLENNLASHVFTPDRIAVLRVLVSQASISLDHARVVVELTQENKNRKKAEGALRMSEERWRQLFENSSAGIQIAAADGHILAANLAWQKILGYTEEELQTLTLSEVTFEEDRAATEARMAECLAGLRRDWRLERRFRRKDGSVIWTDVSVGFVPSSTEGTPSFFITVIVDITERRRAEEELYRKEVSLREAQTELAHVSRVTTMGELAASIAHEVNQPLAAVVNNGSACLRWLAAQNLEEARQSAALVIADGHRAGEIIGRIRALAKKAPPQKDWLDLNETIAEVIAMTRSEVQRNQVSLQTDLANDLPLILGDRIQLQQVILNLLINAVEAMSGVDDGPRELWISSEKVGLQAPEPRALQTVELEKRALEHMGLTEAQWPHVLIAVRDSGPGLDSKGLDRLFDAFYTTKPQGLGMGLAISRSIIEAHGGRLSATANSPRGAVFRFALPIREAR